ncbi:MAG: hypothetical protein LBQ83_03160 [Candidatus Margulisbacteria bacterium]|jgi:hypothetical protein|nr:hypothetical protein [Candidatus Margulisiibacteriota bacterium]
MSGQDYHIYVAQHHDNNPVYALVFKEIILLFLHSFHSLGQNCSFTVDPQLDKKRINIILGAAFIFPAAKFQGFQYIPYQLEQLSAAEGWYSKYPEYKNILQNARAVWDYSAANIDFLRGEGIPAGYLPIGYHEKLELIPRADQQDIDILFYGSLNERRRKILIQLMDRGLKVEVLPNIYGTPRDKYIARAKIVLNIHYYETKIFESARISYLLNNKILVITENSVDNPYPAVELISVPYEQLVEECVRRLADWNSSLQIAASNYQQFKENYPMTGFLAKVLI